MTILHEVLTICTSICKNLPRQRFWLTWVPGCDAKGAVPESVRNHRAALIGVLDKYQANVPLIFGSVARGDATPVGDLDLMVTLTSDQANPWMQLAGIMDEFSSILGVKVDVVCESLLKRGVAQTVRQEAIPL